MELFLVFATMATAIGTDMPTASLLKRIHILAPADPWTMIPIALMLPAQLLLVVIGFHYFEWWIWIGVLLVSRFLFAPVIGLELGVVAQAKVTPLFRMLAIATTVCAWLLHLELF